MSDQSSELKLSLIIPIFNEERVLGDSLEKLARFLDEQKLRNQVEVVCAVTHEGKDRSLEIAQARAEDFVHIQVLDLGGRLGKGRTVAKGMEAASGQYRIFTDADLSTPAHHIVAMLQSLEQGSELVIGVRDLKTMHEGFARRLGSTLSNGLIRLLAAPGIRDTQCGFKGFSAAAAQRIFSQQQIYGWGFDIEVIAMARRFSYTIGMTQIDDWSDPKGDDGLVGDSQVSAMLKTLRELLVVRRNIWSGKYK